MDGLYYGNGMVAGADAQLAAMNRYSDALKGAEQVIRDDFEAAVKAGNLEKVVFKSHDGEIYPKPFTALDIFLIESQENPERFFGHIARMFSKGDADARLLVQEAGKSFADSFAEVDA